MNKGSNTSEPILLAPTQEEEISFADLIIFVAKHKRTIIGFPIIATAISFGITLLMPNIYMATTKILPPQQAQSNTAALMAQLGGVAAAAGGTLGIKNPADLYVGMLKSRTIADALIDRFDLSSVYDVKYKSVARKDLDSNTSIAAGRDGIITIEFEDKDPQRANAIANAYVDELFRMTKALAITEAAQRRLFFEKQLELARVNLIKAEEAAREAINNGGLVKVDEQGRSTVEITARLRAQIAVKEVQIDAMRGYAADMNPQLISARRELIALKKQLDTIESGVGKTLPKVSEISIQPMKNLGLLRDVKYYETVFELMAKQFELAKVDESKDPSIIQVIDIAITPDRKIKPKIYLISGLTFLITVVLALLKALIIESWERAKKKPENTELVLVISQLKFWKKPELL